MFLEKLLNKIPFIRNRRLAKIKKDLAEIKNDFDNGFFNEKYIISLHSIVNNPLVTFSGAVVERSLNDITTYTKTSMSALRLLEGKIYKKTNLDRSDLVSMSKSTKFFSEWYSNEGSILGIIDILNRYMQVQVWLASNPEFDAQEKIDELVSEHIDMELYDSLLYRVLLEDLVAIISFYLEIRYE